MQTFRKFTSVLRTLDPRYPTNLTISVISFLVFLAGMLWWLFSGFAWWEAALGGLRAAIVVLFTWALTRELDPDHEYAAFVAVGLVLAGLLLWRDFSQAGINLLFMAWVLVALRIVNRIVGPPATIFDSIGLLALGGWLAYSLSWIFGGLTALAFLLDTYLPIPNRRHWQDALFALVLTLAMGALTGAWLSAGGFSWASAGMALALALLFLPVLFSYRQVDSTADVDQLPLFPPRIQAAQGFLLLTGVLTAWWLGVYGLVLTLPLWSAVVGALLAWVYRILFKRRS